MAVASEAIRDDARVVACIFTSRVLDDDCRQIFGARDADSCRLDLATLLQPLEGKRRSTFGKTGGIRFASNFDLRRKLEGNDLRRS